MIEIYCRRYDDWYSVPSRSGRDCSWCGEPLVEHPTKRELIEAYYNGKSI